MIEGVRPILSGFGSWMASEAWLKAKPGNFTDFCPGKADVIAGVNSGWQGQPLGKGGDIRGGSGGRAILDFVGGGAIGGGAGNAAGPGDGGAARAVDADEMGGVGSQSHGTVVLKGWSVRRLLDHAAGIPDLTSVMRHEF